LLHLGLSTPFALLSFFIFYFNCYEPLSLFTELIILIKVIFFFQNLFFRKSLSKLSCICLPLEKLVNEKNFPVKKNLAWFPGKCFPEKFGQKTLFRSCEKFRNVILFADYIKFGPQTFDCYIYCFEYLFFNFIS